MHSFVASGPLPTAQREQRAREFLAAGKFRKGRDDFKLLCKPDCGQASQAYLLLTVQSPPPGAALSDKVSVAVCRLAGPPALGPALAAAERLSRERQPRRSYEALRRSLQLDPTNRTAHLTLCGLDERLRMTSDRNRLLDEMTARFPDDKAVLIQTARGCLERKACKRGLGYPERVRQLDLLGQPAHAVQNAEQWARLSFR